MIKENKLDSYCRRSYTVALDSPDEQTKVGAILINKESGAVIASGYNGFIRGADDDNLPKTRPEKYNYIVHAEQNLICNCARHGISTHNCAIFVTLSPCQFCTRLLYQSGITTIYFKDKYRDFDSQIKLGDILAKVTQVGKYTKIELSPNKEFKK
jgi:dCMP deaminase